MAWESVIVGYVRKAFRNNEQVPKEARFLTRQAGGVVFNGNGYTHYETLWWYDVPVYEKKNVKRK